MTEFEGVHPALGQALNKRGYEALTPVQLEMLAPELGDADLLVSAQTGSGKTVAFGIAIAPTLLGDAERFERTKAPLALVIAPTRELALQVQRELQWLYAGTGASVISCVGGMDARTERKNLERGAHIVVGTPGRLCDHINRRAFNPSQLQAIVLDEADEMLDLGFKEDLEYILDAAPEERRTLMFSATVSRSIASLAKRYQRDAVRVVTQQAEKQHVDIEYRALTIAPKDQENAIINVLRYFDADNAIVFCGTRATVNHMTARFNNRGFSVVALSGELSQNERTHALQAMRDGRAKVCIATDVAARGIDLPKLELVIHADLPKNPESLLHRSGRTGRAGRKGTSVLIVPHRARKRTERLLRDASINANWAPPPSVEDVMKRDDERLLADTSLIEPLQENEEAFAKELLQRHSPEQIAAAFVRLYRAGQSAPEELIDVPVSDSKTKQFNNFTNGQWISLSIGRGKKADPGWILAMICRVGDLSKGDVGAIRIDQNATHVEIDPASIDKFMAGVGADGSVEKDVSVTRLDKAPEVSRGGYEKRSFERSRKPHRGKSDRGDRSDSRSGDRSGGRSDDRSGGRKFSKKSGDDRKPGAKRKFDKKGGDRDRSSEWTPRKSEDGSKGGQKRKFEKTSERPERSERSERGQKPAERKVAKRDEDWRKDPSKGKKSSKGKSAGSKFKKTKDKSGSTPLKRKTLKISK
jgi:ATP-dependent RNA helicase DeaD